MEMVSLICTLQDHRDDVNFCAFSGSHLATCSSDKTVRIYSTQDLSELPFSPLTGHGYGVHCCRFSACGQFLASCSTDATTVIWSTTTGDIEAVLEHPGRSPVRVCAFSPDSAHLVSGASDGSLALWDFATKTLSRTVSVSDSTMVACSFSPCGQLLASGSTYGDLRLWDRKLNQLHAEKNAHDLGVTCCCFSPSMLSDSSGMQVWLASCGQDSLLKIWIICNTSSGCKMQLQFCLTGQSAPVLSCCYSADGQLLVSGSVDKTVTVYDASRGVLLYTLNQHDRYVTACCCSPVLPLIASGSMDKTVNIWRLEDGPSQHGVKSLPDEASASSSEGRTLASHSKLLVRDWSEEEVSSWLVEEGLEELVEVFRANNIEGTELLSLTKDTLISELHIESMGLRSKILRKIEELKSACVCSGVPDEFLCPITRELMRDPVIAADGYSYEREAIWSWISTKNRSSPMTNLPLQTTLLTPNRTLKMAIGRWQTSQ